MLVRRGALEKTRARLTRVAESSQSWMASTGEQQGEIEVRLLEGQRGDAPRFCDRGALRARFAWNPAMRPAVTATIARPAAPAGHPGQAAQLSPCGRESRGLMRRGGLEELSLCRRECGADRVSRQCCAAASRPPR